jgi:hypothetical protein
MMASSGAGVRVEVCVVRLAATSGTPVDRDAARDEDAVPIVGVER